MAANTSPIFTLTPVLATAQVSVANANRDGTGTIVDVVTGGTNGTRIHKIEIVATVTTTAGMVRLFIYNGSTTKLWREVAISAVTVSATVAAFTATIELLGERALLLPSGHKIQAATEKAEAINVIANGGDF